MDAEIITVEVIVNASVDKIWKLWTMPEHIKKWNNASADWHTTSAFNDMREEGMFTYRMEAKDGNMGFDFSGTYSVIQPEKYIEYKMDDGRKVSVTFESLGSQTVITEKLEAEQTNSVEMQRTGWQAILHNFRDYAESFEIR